jgi:hypothetical protein
MRSVSLKLLAVPVVAGLVLIAAPATAGGGDDVVRRGSCSGGTEWKLKVKPDDGRLEVEAEVDSDRTGQTWRWALRHDGTVSARGTSTTRGPSGSFEVARRMADLAGADTVVLRAVNVRSGETCRGVLTF